MDITKISGRAFTIGHDRLRTILDTEDAQQKINTQVRLIEMINPDYAVEVRNGLNSERKSLQRDGLTLLRVWFAAETQDELDLQ